MTIFPFQCVALCANVGHWRLAQVLITTSWTFVSENSPIIADSNPSSKPYFHWSYVRLSSLNRTTLTTAITPEDSSLETPNAPIGILPHEQRATKNFDFSDRNRENLENLP